MKNPNNHRPGRGPSGKGNGAAPSRPNRGAQRGNAGKSGAARAAKNPPAAPRDPRDPNINWYPGHMKKATRMIEENLKLVDAVVEIRDARIPESSRNPDVAALSGEKPRMVVLNRVDQADPAVTAAWRRALEAEGCCVLETDCRSGRGVGDFSASAHELLKEQIARWEQRGLVGRTLRFMVLGIPNVGKSSFINRLAGRKAVEAGDRPGVTRGKQWITLEGGVQLLDTPGILWPKLDTPQTGLALAWTGAINDEILDRELVACRLLELLRERYPAAIEQRYQVSPREGEQGWELLERLGRRRGFLVSGGEVDTERMSRILLDEYRAGMLGRISLERP